ncbi:MULTISPECIES: hypothetical protein [unclassified Streptomyces]|uniref:hypothetical protein n=1 Tax=unclassified Streptomyces TaxID=2593676 RepID=UPI0033177E63
MTRDEILEALAAQVGGLIEIYVLGTSYDDWFRVLVRLHTFGYEVSLRDALTEMPANLNRRMFDAEDDAAYELSISIGSQIWTSSLASLSAIDLQGDPRDVRSRSDLDDVFRLLQILSKITGKRAILVPETLELTMVRPYLMVPAAEENQSGF